LSLLKSKEKILYTLVETDPTSRKLGLVIFASRKCEAIFKLLEKMWVNSFKIIKLVQEALLDQCSD